MEIALLTTGDEIIHGDILNSNAQEIAAKLFDHGMHVGLHMSVPDHISEIELALTFLLQHHQAVIITGGLGPTSDDLTRYAVSNVLKRPLIFDSTTWEKICDRLSQFGYPLPPEGNRQQALFPEGSTIITNPYGTAAGCFTHVNQKMIFMLPGPPAECLPMIDEFVLPELKKAHFQQISYHQKWLLFGVSEGKVAEELDALSKPYQCMTGYRLCYPYLEFKLHSDNQHDFNKLVTLVDKTIQPYLISDGKQTASSMLKKKLLLIKKIISISDSATGGFLESLIKTPDTFPYLLFSTDNSSGNFHIDIKGLEEFWNNKNNSETTLEIFFKYKNKNESFKTMIPLRGKRVRHYAAELICSKIIEKL